MNTNRAHGYVAIVATIVMVAMLCLSAAFLGRTGPDAQAAAPARTVTATVTKTVTATATVTATVTATATVTQTVTASPSATDTTSTSPTPTVTPTPTTTVTPNPGAFPDQTNTGVPAGTVLTTYTGPSNVTVAGTVIDGKNIGCIQVSAPNVVIKNSKITCPNTGGAVYVDDRTSTTTLLTLQDVEITCDNTNGTAVGEADITAIRVNIHGCENGFDVNQNIDVEDSYIHDLYNGNAAHADGLQMASRWNGSTYVMGVNNVTIRHNTIYSADSSGALGTSAIISNRSGDMNMLIDNNLFAGGAYTLYCEADTKGTNYVVTNNHFSTKYSPKVGEYGPSTGCSDETQSGNVYHETGQALFLD